MTYTQFIKQISEVLKKTGLHVRHIFRLKEAPKQFRNPFIILYEIEDQIKEFVGEPCVVSENIYKLTTPTSKLINEIEGHKCIVEIVDDDNCNVYVKDRLEGMYLRQLVL